MRLQRGSQLAIAQGRKGKKLRLSIGNPKNLEAIRARLDKEKKLSI